MSKFEREELHGRRSEDRRPHRPATASPLVFFHGAGTVDGFDFAEPWTDRFA